jgi:predicted HTH transcriptional regulator
MEIQNPGMLPFCMNMEDFMDGVSKVRNRVIVCVFQEPGLMEEWKADIEGNWQHGVEAEF